ncbi:MAG: hypothetical protein ACK48U_22040, partial [Planctomyces sp.]
MNMWFIFGGVAVFLSIVLSIAKGRLWTTNGYLDRSASPVLFWLFITLQFVLFLFLAFPRQSLNFVQYGIEDSTAETQRKVQEFEQRKTAVPETDGTTVETQDDQN